MYICLCRGVNEEAVRRAIAAGARDPAAVSRCSGAGTGCGGCYPALCRLLEQCAVEGAPGRDDNEGAAA